MVAVAFWVLAALVVFAIAAGAVGTVTGRLATEPPKNLFDLDEAVDVVADRLPDDVTARVSYSDVRWVLTSCVRFLESRGLASGTMPSILEDTGETGPVVVADDEAIAWVLARLGGADVELDDLDVVVIVEEALHYLRLIGAVGRSVEVPDDPEA